MKTSTSIRRLVNDSIRNYFAPLVGAVKLVRAAYKRLGQYRKRRRHGEDV
jgi:hypothetical protein